MAVIKTSELPAATPLAPDDLFPVVQDTGGGVLETRKVSVSDLDILQAINIVTEDGDRLTTEDSSPILHEEGVAKLSPSQIAAHPAFGSVIGPEVVLVAEDGSRLVSEDSKSFLHEERVAHQSPSQLSRMVAFAEERIITVGSLAELRNIPVEIAAACGGVMLLGYHTADSKGAGLFRWSPSEARSDDGGAIIRLSATAALSPGRMVRHLPPHEPFTPEMFGAKGDLTGVSAEAFASATDDSPAFAAMINAANSTGRDMFFGPLMYMLRDVTTPIITTNASVRGTSPGRSRIVMHPDYRGAALSKGTAGSLQSDPSLIQGDHVWSCFSVWGVRRDPRDGSYVPGGQQHGIILFGRQDNWYPDRLTIENIRGWGLCTGLALSATGGAWLRECSMWMIETRGCGWNQEFAGMDFRSFRTSERSNNVWAFACKAVLCWGAHLRMETFGDPADGMPHLHFNGFQVHGRAQDSTPELQTGEGDQPFPDVSPIVDINGTIGTGSITAISANATFDNQPMIRIGCDYRRPVTTKSNGVSTTLGSAEITITLPDLGSYLPGPTDVTTRRGSPLLYVRWPGHGRVRGDWVTFDQWTNGNRSNFQHNVNGILPRSDMRVAYVVDADNFAIQPLCGIATADGAWATAPRLNVTYGMNVVPGHTLSFDTWDGDRRLLANIALGGLTLARRYNLVRTRARNVIVVVSHTDAMLATSSETLAAQVPVLIHSDMIPPNNLKMTGNINSGAGPAVVINEGLFLDIDLNTVNNDDIEFTVGPGIRGPIELRANMQEDRLTIAVHPSVENLVQAFRAGDDVLTMRSAEMSLGTARSRNSRRTVIHATRGNATQGRMTKNGSGVTDDVNTWPMGRAGTYTYRGITTAAWYAGAAGSVADNATWEWLAMVASDGTPTGVSIISIRVDGVIYAAGAPIPPSIAAGSAGAWRLILSADTTFGALAVNFTGENQKSIAWTTDLTRVLAGNA